MLVSLTDTVEEVSGLCEQVHKRTRGLHLCHGASQPCVGLESMEAWCLPFGRARICSPLPCTFQGLELDRVSHERLCSTSPSQSQDAYGKLQMPSLDVGRGQRESLGSSHLPVTSCCSVPCSLESAGLSQSGESGNMRHQIPAKKFATIQRVRMISK